MATIGLGMAVMAWLSTWHIVLLLVIVLLLFGGKKLPELARGLGRGLRVFKDEMHNVRRDIEEPTSKEPGPHDEMLAGKSDTTEKKS
jgi:sec-independent protein translocase protein TatA